MERLSNKDSLREILKRTFTDQTSRALDNGDLGDNQADEGVKLWNSSDSTHATLSKMCICRFFQGTLWRSQS